MGATTGGEVRTAAAEQRGTPGTRTGGEGDVFLCPNQNAVPSLLLRLWCGGPGFDIITHREGTIH